MAQLLYYSCAVYISTCVYEKYQTKGQSVLNVVQLGLGAIVGNLVGGKLIHLLGYEKGVFTYGRNYYFNDDMCFDCIFLEKSRAKKWRGCV